MKSSSPSHPAHRQKPSPRKERDLASLGVRVISPNRPRKKVQLQCAHCRVQWSARIGTRGKMPDDFWRCPKGCNAALRYLGHREHDNLTVEIACATCGHTKNHIQVNDLRELKAARRQLDKLRRDYSRLRGEQSPPWALTPRAASKLSRSASGRSRNAPKPQLQNS